MPRTKNNFLNAKPVSKMGGKSGGVRKPSKPYSKPSSTSGKPKLQSKPQKPSARDVMPNSRAKKINLPSAANNAVLPKQGPTLKGTKPKTRISANSARDSMPNSRAKGINLPKAANNAIPSKQGPSLKGVKPGLRSSAVASGAGAASRVAGAFGTALAIPAAIKNIKDVAERNKRWEAYKERMGMNQKPNSTNRRGQGSGNKSRSNDMPSKPNWRDKVSSSNVDQLRQGQNATTRSYADKAPATRSNGSSSNRSSRPSTSSAPRSTTAPRSQTPPKPRFTGTVDEGRKMWAEKYSSSKYDGQAIQKEAKKLLDEMKKRREDKSNAQRAGWDGNKNY